MVPYRLASAAAVFVAAIVSTRHGGGFVFCGLAAIAASVLRPRSVAVTVVVSALTGSLLAVARPDVPPILAERTATYDAVVLSAEAPDERGLRDAILRIGDRRLDASLRGRDAPVGSTIRVRGRIEPPDVARNPGEPSPRDLARERDVDGTLADARILDVGSVDASDLSLWPARLRAAAVARLRASLDEPYASIASGVLLGDRATLDPALRREFQETGTVHVLVTAGLHLGVLAGAVVLLAEAAGCGRAVSAVTGIGAVWAYALLTGMHLPSLRAATMATTALGARALGREALSWNALGLAALVVATLRPSSVESVSFALSFSCVGAIVLTAKPLERLIARSHVPHPVGEALALTIATQLGTWPLVAATFLSLTPYAIVANAFVVPLVGLVLLTGLALVACADVPLLGAALANAETTLLAIVVRIVETVSSFPSARLAVVPPPPWTIVLYDAALVSAVRLLRGGRRVLAASLVVVAATLCIVAPAGQSAELRVTVLDVGQADAIVIRTPHGHVVLVDAGGRLERGVSTTGDARAEAVGERIVVPFLLRAGIRHVDALVMTHPHGDHVAGAPPVIRDLDVASLADSGQAYPGHGYRETLELAHVRAIPVLEPRGGTIWRTDDGVTLRFYAPTLPYLTGTRSDINSNSIVFRLEYGAFRMLFTGDAGAETEARLLASHVDLRADVLKVGHHGSAYGTTDAFVRAVAPHDAIISVGRHNLFGHPAPSTIAELERRGVRVSRTDRDGAVTIETGGSATTLTPFVSSAVTPGTDRFGDATRAL